MLALVTTDLLSQKMSAAPSMGTPNIRNLYCSDSIISVAIRNAINSDPKLEDSTVFCLLLNQTTGVLLRYISMPVCDLRVMRLQAWSAST